MDVLLTRGRTMRRRNTQAFTFLAWTSFVCALSGMLIGIYTLDETLSVKGYYLIGTLFLTMSCFVLQKTIRDNEEDNERFPKNKPLDKE
ncbi:YiaAB two helix domain protein [Bacillus cereus BDRD-ST26]|nr:YiaAB two helix domain protein [Bacillus cereus m1293]EEK86053.1 YiaAB two helix domain protein [Bacillus cereus ATCC 4342]EEL02531.1 YiaAB two helix domain protein [Bacillus cereus BDRD-ST26]EEM24516.1 YiaAB two helix domain protein [Bacillus thuringiensis serovar tochigiensis BGSC 4Y1]